MICLTDNSVVELVEGVLEPAAREQVHAHLSECHACRQLVSAVVRLADPADDGEAPEWRGSPEVASDGWLPRGTSIDRYVILEPVGAGSAGTVYAAYDPDLDRRVALKLLRAGDAPADGDDAGREGGEDARAALLREARAMARLSHPHVIAVHDVGATEQGIFVAMELVSGRTLREWREARARSWEEIRDVFVAAGRGLAAAHRAGLIHRDFKPDNVLVGEDGGVRVTDFGLARMLGLSVESARGRAGGAPPLLGSAADPEGLWRLTRTGALVGTPAYMAPEQHLGRPADALSDQFSFCVALFEAVQGRRPFAGQSMDELREAVLRGPPPTEARGGAPAAVIRALDRSLSPEPAARFPSMDALLDEITGHHRARRRRLIALAAATALAATAIAAAWWSRAAPAVPPVCTGAERHLADIWNRDRERAAQAAFSASGVVYAGESWRRVRPILDAYGRGWIAAHTEACRATRVLGEQSEAALDLRMQCLAGRRRELGALVDLMVKADAAVVEGSVQASLDLAPTSDCSDLESLARPVARPTDRATAGRLENLEAELARASALRETGRYREAVGAARVLAPRARALGHPPFLAAVLLLLAELENATGDEDAALRTLDDAVVAADAGRDDARRAEALIHAAGMKASPAGSAESAKLAVQAEAIVGRLRDHRLSGALARARGKMAYEGARVEEARRFYELALREDEAAFPPDDPRLSTSLDLLGDLLERMGDYEAAQRHLDRARRIAEKALGPDHPLTATAYANLAGLATSQGKLDEALALLDRVVAMRERVLGERHRSTALALYSRGEVQLMIQRVDGSGADLERALRVVRSLASPDEGLEALCLIALGKVAMLRGEYDEAVALERRALAIHRRLGDKRNIAPDLYALGETLLRQGKLREAHATLEEALESWQSFLGPDHPHVAFALESIGQVRIKQRRHAHAIAPLERAYRIRGGATTPWGADAAVGLAEALWMARRDDRRAIALIREAAAFWRKHPDRYAENLASADEWLASHRRRR